MYIYAMIVDESLVFAHRQGSSHTIVTLDSVELNVCDGRWKSISFQKVGCITVVITNRHGYGQTVCT